MDKMELEPAHERLTELVEQTIKVDNWRSILDSLSHEFKATTPAEKIGALAKVVYHGYDLSQLINEYKQDYSSEGYRHILNNLKGSLIHLLSFLISDDISNYKVAKQFEGKTENELVETLISLLKNKVIPTYSIKKLVAGYIDYRHNGKSEDEYKRQSRFFGIDFNDKRIENLLIRREKAENVLLPTYINLFSFLQSILERIGDANIDWLPEMGMSLLQFRLCKKHLPDMLSQELAYSSEKRKQHLMNFAIDLTEIIYLNKSPMTNPWLELNFSTNSDYFIHPAESKIIDAFNESLKNEHSESYKIHTEIFPAAFMGNVFDSKVVLLTLNPGFDENEEKKDFYGKYRDWFLKELIHSNRFECPLYCLDEEYAKHSDYWKKRLNALVKHFGNEGKEIVGKRVSKIQFFPYVSKKFKSVPHKLIEKELGAGKKYLPTQEYNFYLVREAIKREAVIIITRSKDLWLDAVKELVGYEHLLYTKNARQPYITENNMKGDYDKIITAINSK